MPLLDLILPEFDQEAATTRKVLERVTDDKLSFKPHDKSWTMAELATHLANNYEWAKTTFASESFDYSPGGVPHKQEEPVGSAKQLMETFDKNLKAAREALLNVTDEQWSQPWSLLANGATVFSMPKIAVYRSFVMNHSIHHRGQMSVYLRLTNIPVPSIYGPSADDQAGM
jgi:uncharacterized damage-inducible protein DinB